MSGYFINEDHSASLQERPYTRCLQRCGSYCSTTIRVTIFHYVVLFGELPIFFFMHNEETPRAAALSAGGGGWNANIPPCLHGMFQQPINNDRRRRLIGATDKTCHVSLMNNCHPSVILLYRLRFQIRGANLLLTVFRSSHSQSYFYRHPRQTLSSRFLMKGPVLTLTCLAVSCLAAPINHIPDGPIPKSQPSSMESVSTSRLPLLDSDMYSSDVGVSHGISHTGPDGGRFTARNVPRRNRGFRKSFQGLFRRGRNTGMSFEEFVTALGSKASCHSVAGKSSPST